jgi:hypothetical protein
MKFMMIVKHPENYGFPPQALMDEIYKLRQQAIDSGRWLGDGGLLPPSAGATVRLSGGKVSVIDGPYTEAKEFIGGYAQFEFASKEEAVESAVQFMELHRRFWPSWSGECEVRQMMVPGEACVSKTTGTEVTAGSAAASR